MPNVSEDKQRTPEKKEVTKVVTLAGRAAVILLLAWVGLSTGGALNALFSDAATVTPDSDSNVAFPQLPVVSAEMLRGRWEIAGMPVSVELRQTDAEQVDATLAQRPQSTETPITAFGNLAVMIHQFKSRMAVLENTQDVQIYGMDEPSMRVRMFWRDGGGTDHILGGNVAVPRGDGNWLVVMIRGCAPLKTTAAQRPPLAELPSGSKRLAMRRAANGTTQCEIVQLQGGLCRASQGWQHAGWAVQQLPIAAADPNSFQINRGSEIVQVHVLAAPGTMSEHVLLVRSPEPIH